LGGTRDEDEDEEKILGGTRDEDEDEKNVKFPTVCNIISCENILGGVSLVSWLLGLLRF
jgi:hypothetical protein